MEIAPARCVLCPSFPQLLARRSVLIFSFLSSLLAHRFATHLDAMSVITVSQRRISDLLVPAGQRQLRSQDHRAGLAAVFGDLPEVSSLQF